jgi:hypothetical protein
MPAAILRSTFLLITLLTLSSAVLVNRTIDDQYGDPITSTFPVYSPIGDWQQGANCSDCAIKPDVSKAFDGTWHDSTFYPGSTPKSVSVTFNGPSFRCFPPSIIFLLTFLDRKRSLRILHNLPRPHHHHDNPNPFKLHARQCPHWGIRFHTGRVEHVHVQPLRVQQDGVVEW